MHKLSMDAAISLPFEAGPPIVLVKFSHIDIILKLTYNYQDNEQKMTDKRTRKDFFDFLDWMSEKGLMTKNTVAARKAAATKILGILNDDEVQDVTSLDLDDIMRRFTNLEGRGYTPGSLTTYQSRLRSALDDFKLYLDKPLNFRPGVQPRERRKPTVRKETASMTSGSRETVSAPAPNALSIPIRPNTTVVIHGLPYDLSETEAAKIANIVRAMVTPPE